MSRHLVKHRRGVTLIELMVICAILGVLMGMVLFALQGATEQARADRTRAQVVKINDLIMSRWEGYRQRPLPLRMPAGTHPGTAAQIRLQATWCLMRLEIPERKTDILADVPSNLQTYGMKTPSLLTAYRAKLTALTGGSVADQYPNWSYTNQQAECLYLILSTLRDGDTTGLDFFTSSEVKDTDGDGVPEIVDGWGQPIRFLRWAPGFASNVQSRDASQQPDPFDPLKIINSLHAPDGTNPQGFALFPLIMSAGPDKTFDIFLDREAPDIVDYSSTTPANFPYSAFGGNQIGAPLDIDNNGSVDNIDNITNHLTVTR